MPYSARSALRGFSFTQDRLWLLHTPHFTAGITEYNDELTGYDPRLAELDPKVFHYGGNAYYILTHYAPQHGWKSEKVDDRSHPGKGTSS